MASMRLVLLSPLLLTTTSAVSSSDQQHPFLRQRTLQDGNATTTAEEGECNDCIINGIGYCAFEQYPNPSCLPNVCSCSPTQDANPCTFAACERDCGLRAVCTHNGQYYCAGDQFYHTSCMANTCRCSDNGKVGCTKMACFEECASDDDCTASVRSQTAQDDLYPLCGCEARSTVDFIAERYKECLGEDEANGISCKIAKCTNTCEGLKAVCTKENKCELAPDVDPDDASPGTLDADADSADSVPEEECTCIGMDGVMYCPGDSYIAPDGCNECTCAGGPDGNAKCTKMACPTDDEKEEDTPPAADDKDVDPDEEEEDGTSDTASTLETEEDCTCIGIDNVTYCPGDTYIAPDGCNECTCAGGPDGLAKCTKKACLPEDEEDGTPPAAADEKDAAESTEDKVCVGNDGETYQAGCKGMNDIMYCIGDSYTASDGCNSCTCSNDEGLAFCTVLACVGFPTTAMGNPPENVTCTYDGKTYVPGDTYMDTDKCNQCSCTDNGMSACTLMICDVAIAPEDSTTLPETEEVPTTLPETDADCSACEGMNGKMYCVGDSFSAPDGCNTCVCSSLGAECTEMVCEATTPSEVAPTCVVNGIEYAVGESFTASDGCNTCTCSSRGELHPVAACTEMACETGEDGLPQQLPEEDMEKEEMVEETEVKETEEEKATTSCAVTFSGAAAMLALSPIIGLAAANIA